MAVQIIALFQLHKNLILLFLVKASEHRINSYLVNILNGKRYLFQTIYYLFKDYKDTLCAALGNISISLVACTDLSLLVL